MKYDGLCLAKLDKTFCDMAYDLNREEKIRWLLKQEYKTTYKDFTPYAKEFLERQYFALAPFKDEDVVVVTKNWLIEQYDKAFGNTSWSIENIRNYISSLQ